MFLQKFPTDLTFQATERTAVHSFKPSPPLLPTMAILLVGMALAAPADAADVGPPLKTLLAAGPQGAGHREAAEAWQQVAHADAAQLPVVLAALDNAGPLAANWIRAAVETIAERHLQRGGRLPAAELEQFLRDTRHAPRARRLAYEWLAQVDPTVPGRLLPGMLNDPSLELRRDAVARVIGEAVALATSGKSTEAAVRYDEAFAAARDTDQVNLLADRLRKLGRPVDLARHFGFLVAWKIIGPFDNKGQKGFDVAYPPEQRVDFQASCPGKHGEVRWIEHTTKDNFGHVDFNRVLGEEKGVIAYAAAEFLADKPQPVEFRMASFNALKLWLNGKLIDQHHVYHGGSQMDQYVSPATLQPGRNLILLKACQNEQTQEWARHWGFQLRVCDALGTAVLSADRKEAAR